MIHLPPTEKRSRKAGLPPGTLVYIGEDPGRSTQITIIEYDEVHYKEWDVSDLNGLQLDPSKKVWINLNGLHNTDLISQFGGLFGIHPLILEDLVNTAQRPKLESYDDQIFLVMRMLQDDSKSRFASEQVGLILGPGYLLSFQERPGDVFDPIRERLRQNKGRLRRLGSDYLAYSLLDSITDSYFTVLEHIEDDLEDLESRVVENPTQETLQSIYLLRRDMVYIRRSVWPLREVAGALERGDSELIAPETRIYLRDVYDHVVQMMDIIETSRELLAGMLDVYLNSVSNRMNEVMKVLTIIATIFIPLTFIVGVYGMNFTFMPELEIPWAYPLVWILMLGIAAGMVAYFRGRDWL